MVHKTRDDSAEQQYQALGASGSDYLLLAAALAVPLYSSGLAVLQPELGATCVTLSWLGMAASYLVRVGGMAARLTKHVGYIMLGLALLVAINLDVLNRMLPGGGFAWQLAPAAFLCWFIIISSFFLWSDDAMLFQLVPAIALFGVQSYIETAGHFEISLVLFMISVAVLLTRLHTRVMYSVARAAGYKDLNVLYRGPWRAVAGPALAIASVLLVGGASWFIAPPLGGAVRKLAGEPEFRAISGNLSRIVNPFATVAAQIGNGPATSSNITVLKMTTRFPQIEYLRSQTYGAYKGSGWDSSNETNLVSLDPQNEKPTSNVEHARVFVAAPPADVAFGQRVALTIDALYRSLARSFSPGFPVRIEYQGGVSLHDGDFLAMDRLVGQGRTFYQEALLPVTSPEFLRAAPPANREGLRDFYVRDVRDRIPPAVHSLARRIADRESNDYDLVRAFIAEIDRRCKYNLKADPIPRNADRVQAFLFDTHEGYCDLFASSLAVLCRTAGLRARVVTGYLVDHRTRRGDTYTIRDRDAHMWTEVYFQGYGWVPFDATADAEEVPGGGVGALLDDEESGGNLEFGAWIGGTVFGLALLALLIGSFRNRLTDRRAVDANMARLRPLYARYLRALQGTLRRPKSPGETTREYAAAFSLAAQDGQTAMRIAGAFENALYSSAPANGDLLRSLREDISKLDVQRSANGS